MEKGGLKFRRKNQSINLRNLNSTRECGRIGKVDSNQIKWELEVKREMLSQGWRNRAVQR